MNQRRTHAGAVSRPMHHHEAPALIDLDAERAARRADRLDAPDRDERADITWLSVGRLIRRRRLMANGPLDPSPAPSSTSPRAAGGAADDLDGASRKALT